MGKRVLTQMTTRIVPRRAAPGTRAAIGVQPPAVKPSLALFALLVVAVSSGAACKRQIGDDCKTASDCDPSGSRACDLSQPGGYCTIQGCNETTCPSEATCIRYFPAQFLTKPCNPAAEDRLSDRQGRDGHAECRWRRRRPGGWRSWPPERLRRQRNLPVVGAVRAAGQRAALLREGLLGQRRLSSGLRVPTGGTRGQRDPLLRRRGDHVLLCPLGSHELTATKPSRR